MPHGLDLRATAVLQHICDERIHKCHDSDHQIGGFCKANIIRLFCTEAIGFSSSSLPARQHVFEVSELVFERFHLAVDHYNLAYLFDDGWD